MKILDYIAFAIAFLGLIFIFGISVILGFLAIFKEAFLIISDMLSDNEDRLIIAVMPHQ